MNKNQQKMVRIDKDLSSLLLILKAQEGHKNLSDVIRSRFFTPTPL